MKKFSEFEQVKINEENKIQKNKIQELDSILRKYWNIEKNIKLSYTKPYFDKSVLGSFCVGVVLTNLVSSIKDAQSELKPLVSHLGYFDEWETSYADTEFRFTFK